MSHIIKMILIIKFVTTYLCSLMRFGSSVNKLSTITDKKLLPKFQFSD